ncbi:MAG TPA: Flp family type IVb pilin, partial [Acetobacteraceae bacterium]|nr:Flp family type IVb pilin [Acetobacteraceae bacterium]
MLYLMSKYESLKSDRRGVTALEYAVVAAVVIAAVVAAFGTFGSQLTTKMGDILTSVTNAGAATT